MIRVWLEPGYDFGRFGVWMLDLPGCFVWADDREAALARVPERVNEFRAWLDRHGRGAQLPETTALTVVEEVPATWVDDEEINATFEADRRIVTTEDLDQWLGWLGDARADLIELLGKLNPATDQHQVARRSRDRDADRPVAAVARHVGGAEIWMVGRLDRSCRYEGPGLDADLRTYLAATRSWAVERIETIQRNDPAVEATDRRGESWTIGKVLRRLIYHSLDHLAELERVHGR